MVTINNEDIRDVYHYLATIDNVLQKEIRLVKGNKSHLDKMVPEQLAKTFSLKEKTASDFTDKITKTTYENSVVSLVSAFERVVFTKYKTTFGELKTVVRDSSPNQINYYKSREKFINGNIDKLSGIIHLIEGHLSNELLKNLNTLKDHRNYIAHGKREDVPLPSVEMPIAVIAKILDEVIFEIESQK